MSGGANTMNSEIMNSEIMNSEMMIRLAFKLGKMTGDGKISWSRILTPKDVLIGDEYWSSEVDGKCFRVYEYLARSRWYSPEVRLELWDTEHEKCEARFPKSEVFSNLLNFVRNQDAFSESTQQYVLKLVNAAS